MSSHTWKRSSGSSYWKDPVSTSGSLPSGAATGEIRLVLDTDELYEYNGASWQKI